MLNLKEINEYRKDVYWDNKCLGYFYIEIDGFWVYYPRKEGGFWSSYSMREIANKLDWLNKPWKDHLKQVLTKDNEYQG